MNIRHFYFMLDGALNGSLRQFKKYLNINTRNKTTITVLMAAFRNTIVGSFANFYLFVCIYKTVTVSHDLSVCSVLGACLRAITVEESGDPTESEWF